MFHYYYTSELEWHRKNTSMRKAKTTTNDNNTARRPKAKEPQNTDNIIQTKDTRQSTGTDNVKTTKRQRQQTDDTNKRPKKRMKTKDADQDRSPGGTIKQYFTKNPVESPGKKRTVHPTESTQGHKRKTNQSEDAGADEEPQVVYIDSVDSSLIGLQAHNVYSVRTTNSSTPPDRQRDLPPHDKRIADS